MSDHPNPTGAEDVAKAARAAYEASQLVDSKERDEALFRIRDLLVQRHADILQANQKDLDAAKPRVEAGELSSALYSRLSLQSEAKFEALLAGITDVVALPCPTDQVTYARELDDELELYRVTCPIGVLLVIFEARPEVVINIAALALKSGNAAILKPGRESLHTTTILSNIIQTALSSTPYPPTFIQTVSTRSEISALLAQDKYIDLVMPRGGAALVRSIKDQTKIPVMGHADGLCHAFLDESADAAKAERIVIDSKLNYVAACNALETLIVHSAVLPTLWPTLSTALLASSITLICDSTTLSSIPSSSRSQYSSLIQTSTPETYHTEHLSPTLSVLSVPSLSAAIKHINAHSSHHTDVIVTQDEANMSAFTKGVDSAGVFVNASTRFADGFRYGFGTEVGISTGKTHARGPVGLDGLCIYKYVVRSKADKGHIVAEFGSGEGQKQFSHRHIQASVVPF